VPDFSVITNRYFKEVILDEIREYCKSEITDWDSVFKGDSEEKIGNIIEVIKNHKIREEFKREIEKIVKDGSYYAVRSSSVEEDSSNFSFAGQFETYLYVRKENMLEKVKEVWISSFSSHVMRYRKEGKINNEVNVPAVIIQEMINSEKAGVGFSVNPVNGDHDEIVISGTFGLGTSIVDGDENGDLFIYNKETKEIKKEIGIKKVKQSLDFENHGIKIEEINVEDEVLNDAEITELGENIINIEKYYGKPQDMEWAFEKGKLYILQSRPITTLEKTGKKTYNTIIWDNSNIVESYPEITLPLTFSFIRKAYSDVYKRFSEITGVPAKVVESYQDVYDNMLGLLKGRVYYNLINWYKLLMLFPNSKGNSKFMEQMMGVKKELSEENLNENLLEAEGKMTGFEKFRIKYELCEIILCDVNSKLSEIGFTIMDGPFFSIMPFGKTGYHSLTSVTFTPHTTSYDSVPTFACQKNSNGFCTANRLGNCNACPSKPSTAYPYMANLAKKYLLDDYTFGYKESLFSMKPILMSSEIDDSRPTVIRTYSKNPTFVGVLSGKINTVYDLDEVLDNG